MDKFITTMERRINYLSSESRRMFGLLAEKKYVSVESFCNHITLPLYIVKLTIAFT